MLEATMNEMEILRKELALARSDFEAMNTYRYEADERCQEWRRKAEEMRSERDAALERASYIDVDGFRVGPCMYRSLKEQLSEALEREQALAAHVEEFRDFVEYVRKSVRRNGEYAPLITQEMDELLGTPYQRNYRQKRDLIKQAEVLEQEADAIRMGTNSGEYLKERAADLLQQAAAL